jgi:chromosomal replication initiation ATPase DnaA
MYIKKHKLSPKKSSKDIVDHERIIQKVAEFYEVTAEEILGRSRVNTPDRPIVDARQVAMVLTWKALGGQYSETGRCFNRYPQSVAYARKKLEARFSWDKKFKNRWCQIRYLGVPSLAVLDYQI